MKHKICDYEEEVVWITALAIAIILMPGLTLYG